MIRLNVKIFLITIFIFLILAPAINATNEETISVKIDGILINFDVEPTIINDRTLVPMRPIFEALGFQVKWNERDNSVLGIKEGVRISLAIGNTIAIKNNQRMDLDVPASIINDRTMVPLRFVAESSGADVEWKEDTRTAEINKVKNEDILKYNIPKGLGKPKLTQEEITTLVGQEPSILKEKLSTVSDFLQYMISANFKVDNTGDRKIQEGIYTWHFNRPAESTLLKNEGNCGAVSNVAVYILENNYDEIGFINFSADTSQGGHVFNYIKQNNKYYIIDFLQYPMSDYNRYNYRILELDKLEDYPEYCKRDYGGGGQNYQIKVIVSYIAKEQIPIANYRSGNENVMRFFPDQSELKVLYETKSEGKVVEFIKGPTSTPVW